MKGPCKGCTTETGRSVEPNCHATCEKYLTYLEENNKRKKIINKARYLEHIQDQIVANRVAAVTKERRRKK